MRLMASIRALRVTFFLTMFVFGLMITAWPAAARAQTEGEPGIQAMKLVGGQSGWLLANDRLFWTTSLGAKWTEVTPPKPPTGPDAQIHGVFFNAAGNGWVVWTSSDQKSFTIAHTADQGAHWASTSVESPFGDGRSFGGNAFPFFADGQHGWLMLTVQSSANFRPGVLFQTEDGGAHWTRLQDPPVGGDVIFSDLQHGFTGPGPRGDELFSTADAGHTWQAVPLPSPSADLARTTSSLSLPSFGDPTHGVLVRTYDRGQGTTTVRYATSDGGASWKPAAPVQNAPSTIVAITADGAATARIAPVKSSALSRSVLPSGVAANLPIRATFSNATQGWVLFASGSCQNASTTCTQTSMLQGTLDGGKTFFSLGKIPGISLETTRTVNRPGGHSLNVTPNVSTPYAALPHATPQATTLPSASPLINQMGFDKCEILTTAQMQDWYTNSPYRAVGAYIGGNSEACTNLGFTPGWAATVLAQGWGIIPIWVGPQAPNSTFANKIGATPAAAAVDGTTQADLAAAQMAALGFGPGSVTYYDMEAYTRTTASIAATQAFVNAWTLELHAKGYHSAIYSSHPEIADWDAANIANSPDAIWFAYFFSTGVPCGTKCQNTVSSDIPTQYWATDQRLRQTSSSFTSTYGSTAASIDEDWTDGPVVIVTGNRLNVATAGTGAGSVTSEDTFISCQSVCSAVYAPNTTVTLQAAAASLSTFTGWTGCTSTSGTTCTVSVAAASTVTATFNITPPVFTIASSVPSLTWNLGGSAGTNITVSPKAPYQGTFAFSCTGLPSYLGCAFLPSTVTADGSGATLTTGLTLTASSAIAQNQIPHSRSTPIQLALLLVSLLGAPLAFRRRSAAKSLLSSRLLVLLIAVSSMALTQLATACSSGGTPAPKPLYSGTIQVTATSAGTSQQMSIPVTVNGQ